MVNDFSIWLSLWLMYTKCVQNARKGPEIKTFLMKHYNNNGFIEINLLHLSMRLFYITKQSEDTMVLPSGKQYNFHITGELISMSLWISMIYECRSSQFAFWITDTSQNKNSTLQNGLKDGFHKTKLNRLNVKVDLKLYYIP